MRLALDFTNVPSSPQMRMLMGQALAPDASAEVRKAFAAAGLMPVMTGSAAFGNLIRQDLKLYGEVQQRARIVVE